MAKKYFPNPQNKTYLQNNRTNVFPLGNLWGTFNMDFQTNIGVARVSPRMKVGSSTSDDADLGCPVAFRNFDTKNFAICGTRVFKNDGTVAGTWTEDASTGAQTDYDPDASDMEIFNSSLCATTADALYSKATNGSGTGDWTSRDALSGGTNHVMTYFKKFNRLYYSNLTDNIISIDNTWTTADPGADYAISLSDASDQYSILSMRASSSFIWIGTLNAYSNGRPGKVVQWDGISQQTTNEFELNNAQACMAIAINPIDDSPYTMDSNGILSAWNGSGFIEIGRLPFPFYRLPYNINDSDNEKFIHPNGMYFTKNGTLRCNINNRSANSTESVVENMPSGVWEWTKENGFYHVQSFSYNPTGSSTITDWGQNRISRIGALTSMNNPSSSYTDGTFLAGATIYTDATNSSSVIAFDNSKNEIQKKGYMVTDWFESGEIADSWDVWWMSYRKFLDPNDSIVLKYRVDEVAPVEGTITWTSTTTFTVANSAVVVSDYWTSGTGGEVEILRGTGGGLCAHIINAVNNAGTWTVTIDETATGVTNGTATGRFQKWIKLDPAETLASPRNWGQFAIGTESTPRIQMKICFTYTGNGEYYKGVLTSNEDITASQ